MEEGAKMELGSGKPLHNSTDNCYDQMIFDVFSSVCTTLPHHSGVGSPEKKIGSNAKFRRRNLFGVAGTLVREEPISLD